MYANNRNDHHHYLLLRLPLPQSMNANLQLPLLTSTSGSTRILAVETSSNGGLNCMACIHWIYTPSQSLIHLSYAIRDQLHLLSYSCLDQSLRVLDGGGGTLRRWMVDRVGESIHGWMDWMH